MHSIPQVPGYDGHTIAHIHVWQSKATWAVSRSVPLWPRHTHSTAPEVMLSTGKDSVIHTNKGFVSKSVAGQRTQLLSFSLLGEESSVKNLLLFFFYKAKVQQTWELTSVSNSPVISAVQRGRLLVLTQAQLSCGRQEARQFPSSFLSFLNHLQLE